MRNPFLTFALSAIFLSAFSAFASGPVPRDEMARFHAQYDMSAQAAQWAAAYADEEIKLPTSPGYDQGGSGLCWSYATLSAIETNYIIKHPGSHLALSRAVMQYLNWEDRYLRKFKGIENHLLEGGVTVNAIDIIRNVSGFMRNTGLFAFADFHPDPAPTGMTSALGADLAENLLYPKLEENYQNPPAVTHTEDGREIAPLNLAKEIIGADRWMAYGRSTGQTGINTHYDSDARKGTLAKFLNPKQFESLIIAALRSGHALTVSWNNHEEEIFGVDIKDGAISSVMIKGSYGPDYLRTMSAAAVGRMDGVSTVEVQGF